MSVANPVNETQLRLALLVHASFRSTKTGEQWWEGIGADLGLSGHQARGLARYYGLELPPAFCCVDDCDTPTFAKGMCAKHYFRLRTHGSTDAGARASRARETTCHPSRKHVARGLCNVCYKKWWESQHQ